MGLFSVLELIDFYTREAGVRGLEREIAALCRGAAAKIAGGHKGDLVIGVDEVHGFLGPQRFIPEMKTRTWGPGLATGLAWTPVGGEILFIESSKMPGSGRLSLTGKLGEVMKESASAALTYIRAHAEMLGLDPHMFADIDLHVHVPEGAIPKDGPSAGLAMVASIIVADEPTGNLDSDSAKNVMETLYNVSKGKLVVVVTHSYEQAEPYATRKIMMRDGRIVEDRKLDRQGENENDMESGGFPYEKRAGKHGGKGRINGRKGRVNGGKGRVSGKLSPVSQLRLGVRNTFNLVTKFFLLLFIFLFMTVAVTGGYASKLSAESDESISGTMDFFFEKSPERLILKKNDGKAFSKSDIDRISATDNIDHIVKNDISLDSSVQIHGVAHFARAHFARAFAGNVGRAQALGEHGLHGRFNAGSGFGLVQAEAQHHGRAEDGSQRVGDALAGNVWGAAVAGFVKALLFVVEAGRGQHADAAGEHGGFVAEDVAKEEIGRAHV